MANNLVSKDLVVEADEMVDVIFDLDGLVVPEHYHYLLWKELVRCLPWLDKDKKSGVHPLRGSVSGSSLLLSKRTKLILRVPADKVEDAGRLSGQQLNIEGNILKVGKAKEKELQAATTLHAYIVQSALSEVEFLADMQKQLQAMNIPCNLICDKHREISDGKQMLQGFGLVLHDLKLPVSLQIQRTGLGGARHLGCGIFVPFKAISGLD